MARVTKVLVPAALLAALAAGAVVFAQPPDGPRDRKGGPDGDKKGRGDRKGGPERPDPAVEAWLKVLTEKMADPHDTVRDSARAALVAVGREAVPALEVVADGTDPARATAARRVIAQIDRGRGPDGPPGYRADPRPPLDRVLVELNLTDEQAKQVEALKATHQKNTRELHEEARAGRLDRGEVRGRMDKLGDDAAKALKALLTPEQAKRLGELVPAGPPLFPPPPPPGGRGGPPPPPRGDE